MIADRLIEVLLPRQIRECLRLDLGFRGLSLVLVLGRIALPIVGILPVRVKIFIEIYAAGIALPGLIVLLPVRHLILLHHLLDRSPQSLGADTAQSALDDGDSIRIRHRDEMNGTVLEHALHALPPVFRVLPLHLQKTSDLPHDDLGDDIFPRVDPGVNQNLVLCVRIPHHDMVKLSAVRGLSEGVERHFGIICLQLVQIRGEIIVAVGSDLAEGIALRKRHILPVLHTGKEIGKVILIRRVQIHPVLLPKVDAGAGLRLQTIRVGTAPRGNQGQASDQKRKQPEFSLSFHLDLSPPCCLNHSTKNRKHLLSNL